MRGFGKSTAMSLDYAWSLDTVVDDFISLMDGLGVEKFHVAAAKIGGAVARSRILILMHASQHDDRNILEHVKERVRKSSEDGSSNFTFGALVQLRVRREMCLGPFDLSHERGCLINVGLIVSTDCNCDFGCRCRSVTNRVAHYLVPALALISTSVTVGSSVWARW